MAYLFLNLTRLLFRLIFLSLAATTLIVTINYINVLILRRKLPPGPFPLPIIGNHYRIPRSRPWIKFEEWSRQYANPMITIWIGSRPVIVLNDAWTASDLFEKHADVWSSRPRFVAMGDMVDATSHNQVALKYGDRWRLHRKLTHSIVGTQAVSAYRPLQSDESKILTLDLLNEPSDFVMSVERYSVSVVSVIGWGRRIARKNDYVCRKALDLMELVIFVCPGYVLVESIPFLAKLPTWLYAMPSAVRAGAMAMQKYFCALNREALALDPDGSRDSFARKLLMEQQAHNLSDGEVANLTSNLIGGGVDTTSGTLLWALVAMCAFPEVQAKAQAEIDAIVGQERSPVPGDAGSLLYVQALVKEIFRWRPVAILGGLPHAPTRDDVYRGYHIPANTWVIGNLWAIHRDPREFPDPDKVQPERFLVNGVGGLAFNYPNSRGYNTFGWGRRQCSGQPLAEQSVLMVLTRLLWAFKIEPGLDENGREFQVDIMGHTESENTRPLPFKARFTPRSDSITKLIKLEAEEARRRLSIYDGETKLTVESVLANTVGNAGGKPI